MEVGSPEWIEASLARLDDLERQRGEHETAIEDATDPAVLKQHTEALDRLDTEIKSLYAQLEAVAEDDEDDEGDDEAEVEATPRATQGDDELSAPHFSAAEPAKESAPEPEAPAAEEPEEPDEPDEPEPKPMAAAPVAAAVAASDDPFGGTPSSGDGGGFDAAPVSFSDDDLKPKGAGGKWVFLGLVVAAGLGVGGFFLVKNMQKKDNTPAAPAGPVKVIEAPPPPDDTEAPRTAPSGEVTISPNANTDADANSKKKKKKDDEEKRPLKLKTGDGPL